MVKNYSTGITGLMLFIPIIVGFILAFLGGADNFLSSEVSALGIMGIIIFIIGIPLAVIGFILLIIQAIKAMGKRK